MISLNMTIEAGHFPLEAVLELPSEKAAKCPAVAVCHPHPLYGGNMENNVVLSVSRSLAGAGIACLRFNFRGVGRSGGAFDNGIGEQDDLKWALEAISGREEIDPGRIGVAGYSFGGMVAMAVGEKDNNVRAIGLISPLIIPGALSECPKPKLVVSGSADSLIAPSLVLESAEAMAEPKIIEIIPGADHFWWGKDDIMAEMVTDFFSESLADRAG
ncbi:MAG: alpha/beta hydrolase [Bacillota bacterium]